MFGSLKTGIRRLRILLVSLLSLFITAIVITPAAAARELSDLDGSAMAVVILFGVLMFALVFEVWRQTARRAIPVRNRGAQDWDRSDR